MVAYSRRVDPEQGREHRCPYVLISKPEVEVEGRTLYGWSAFEGEREEACRCFRSLTLFFCRSVLVVVSNDVSPIDVQIDRFCQPLPPRVRKMSERSRKGICLLRRTV